MANKPLVLFLSDRNRYLQHDLYCQLGRNIPADLEAVFLASDYKSGPLYRKNAEEDRAELAQAFSKCLQILEPVLDRRPIANPMGKVARLWRNYTIKRNWRRELLNLIDEIGPKLIVVSSTKAENTRVLSRYRPAIPKLYVQPCNLRFHHKGRYTFKEKLKNIWFNQIIRLPILPVKETTFDHYGKMHLALWSPIWKKHAIARNDSYFHFTGNPIYDQYFNRFSTERAYSNNPEVWIYLNKEKNNGQKNWDLYAEFYRDMMRIQPDFHYVFKAHPHSQIEKIRKAFPGAQVTKELAPKQKVEIMITHWSTTALEFIAEGIPTILVNPSGQFDFAERYLDHYEGIARSTEDIDGYFKMYQKEGSKAFLKFRSNFVKQSLTYDDGKNTARVISLIKQLSRPA